MGGVTGDEISQLTEEMFIIFCENGCVCFEVGSHGHVVMAWFRLSVS